MAQDTFTISGGTNDQWVYRSATGTFPPTTTGPAWDATSASVQVENSKYSADYYYEVGLFKWDTSTLPDFAQISGATLRVYVTQAASPDARNLTGGWYVFGGVGTPADYTYPDETSAITGVAVSTMTTPGYYDITLSNAGANISKTGMTGIRLFISGAAPAVANYLWVAADEHTTETAAQLIVDYTLPPAQRMVPDAIISRTNLPNVNGVVANDATALAAIDEDPDSADANWLTV